MPFALLEVLSALLSALAAGSAAELLVKAIREVRDLRRSLGAAKEESFVAALNSADIQTLGSYLDDVIGTFTVRQYASDPHVADRVDNYLDRLTDFLGTDEQIAMEAVSSPAPETVPEEQTVPDTEPEQRLVAEAVLNEESWNLLARMRRDIEIELRHLAEQNQLQLKRARGAGSLLTALYKAEVIPERAYQDLKYAVSVANRAVHGLEVSPDEVSEVVFLARRAFKKMGLPLPLSPNGA